MRELAERLGGEKEEEEKLSVRELRYAKAILKSLGKRLNDVNVVFEKDKLHILPGREEEALREMLLLFKISNNLERDEMGRVLRDSQLVDLLMALFHTCNGEEEKEKKSKYEKFVDLPIVHKFRK